MDDMYRDGKYKESNPTRQVESILTDNQVAFSDVCEIGCGTGEFTGPVPGKDVVDHEDARGRGSYPLRDARDSDRIAAGDVSVVLCSYNGADFVEEQLASILLQTLPPAEIIISDDGSTDDTMIIVEKVAESSAIPIRILRNESRRGFSDNFLGACAHAKSRFVAFSDQDDRWAAGKLAKAHATLSAYGAVLCVHDVEHIGADGTPAAGRRRRRSGPRVVAPLQSNPWGNFLGFTMLFERALLDRIPAAERGRDPHTRGAVLSHDRWIYFLASTFGTTVVLDEDLAQYRQHGGQLYGGERIRTLRERTATKLSSGQGQASYLAGVAAHRVAILEAADSDPLAGEPSRAGAAWWRTVESHWRRRASLYDAMPTVARLRLLAANVAHGTYRGFGHGGLGGRRLLEDLAITALKVR